MEEFLRAAVIKNAHAPPHKVVPRAMLAADLGCDSLAFLLILTGIEEKFGIVMPVEDMDELRDITFERLVELVLEVRSGSPKTS